MTAGPSLKGQQGTRSVKRAYAVRDSVADFAAWVGRAFLLLAVLAAPWLLGAVQAYVQVWIAAALLTSLGSVVLYLLIRSPRSGTIVVPFAVLPPLLAIGLGFLHLAPLGVDLLAFLSPQKVAIHEEFSSETLPTGEKQASVIDSQANDDRSTVTVCPAATRQSLALLVLATTTLFLACILFPTPELNIWLLGLIAVNGAAIAFFGLAQNLTWNGQIYWSIVLTNGGGPFGPFINRNNGGGYLVLCLAAAIALTLWCLGNFFSEWDRTAKTYRYSHSRTNVASRVRLRVLSALAELNARTLTWLTLAGLLIAGICCTLSRGSVLAMLAAVLVTVTIMSASQRRGLAVFWPVAVMAVGMYLIGWVGLSDEVGARLATLFEDEVTQQGRWLHWQDGLRAAADFPRTGSGLGTYRFVYPEYQTRFDKAWFHYAENVYLQVLVEGGVPGLLLLVAGFGLIAASIWRLLMSGSDLTTLALAFSGVFALTGQMVASMFDFGLFIPANLLLFALLSGTLAGNAAQLGFRRAGGRLTSWIPALGRSMAVLTAGGLIAGCFWSMREIHTLAPVEKALREVRLAGELQDLSGPELTEHTRALTDAAKIRPDDPELQRRLAELWMQRYQVETARELQARTSFSAEDPRLRQLASPLLVHQRAWLYTRSKLFGELESLRQSDTVSENLTPALHHLIAARRACPLLPEVHCGIAQLCGIDGPASEDEIHIRRTRRLAPGNPDLLYICGLLDYQAGRMPAAYANWKASLTLCPRYLLPVLQIAGAGLATPGVVEQILPDSPASLVQLAQHEFSSPGLEPIRLQLLERAGSLLRSSDLPQAELLFLQGSIQVMREAYPEAIQSYTQAVKLRSNEVSWRYELARLLQKEGLLDEAHMHAQRCARLEPQNKKHAKLLEEIHHTRLTRTFVSEGS